MPSAHALENTLPASNALGQNDGLVSAPEPIYIKAAINNAGHKLGLNGPVIGIALDSAGDRLFINDTANHRVLVYGLNANDTLVDRTPDYVLGQQNFYTVAALSTQAGFEVPNGLALSGSSLLFVAESNGSRVKIFDITTITNGEDAAWVLGQINFTGSLAAVTQEGMSAPDDVAYDSTGQRLFVSDITANRVTVYDLRTIDNGEAAVSVLGQANFTGTTAATTQAGMNVPYGLALSGTTLTTLFVAQGIGNRVTAYDVTAITDGENAVKVLGQANFTGTDQHTTQAGMNAPRGIVYNSATQILYVAQTTGNRVTTYNVAAITDGENAINVLGQTNFTNTAAGNTQGGLNAPSGVLYDNANTDLYVLQSTSNRVSVFDLAAVSDGENAVDALGQTDNSISAPLPIYTKSTINNAPYSQGMNAPQGVAVDNTNHRLFISDSTNNRVLVYNLTTSNVPIDLIPDNVIGQLNFYTNTATTTQSGVSLPAGLTFDQTGNRLFVADGTNNRILVFDTATIVDGEGAVGVLGQVVYTVAMAASTQIGLFAPKQIAYDSTSQDLFVADQTNNRVMIYSATPLIDGAPAINVLGQNDGLVSAPEPIFIKAAVNNAGHKLGLNTPVMGMALDSAGDRLFINDTTNNRVLVYGLNANDTLIDRTPDYVLGQPNFYAVAAASTQAGFETPNGLTLSGSTLLFVAESAGSRVKIFDITTITNGEDAISVLGQTSYTGTTAAVTQAGMSAPDDVLYDAANARLYVSDITANRVTVYSLAPGFANYMSADNALGQYDDSLSAPGPIFTKSTTVNKLGLSAPVIGMAQDTVDHRLFISDTVNNRVLSYNLDVNNLLVDRIPDNVLGQLNFYSASAGSTQIGMQVPNGLAYDSTNKRLFVAQTTGHRVTVYDVTSITDGENAINVLGQVNFTTITAATTQVGMNVPTDVAYGGSGSRLYVAQNTGNRVTVYDLSNGITDGEAAINVLGQANFTVTAPATTQAGMNIPFGLALSGTTLTTLFVSQGTGNRVTTYDVTSVTDGENAVKVLGQVNFTATAAATTQAGMNAPRGIAYNSATQILYVAQITGNRVTTYDVAAITDGENAINVLGQTNFTNTAAAATQGGLSNPTGVLYDNANTDLYVLQSNANRVSIFDLAAVSDGENAVDALGQFDSSLSAPGPVYTKSSANNVPHKLSLSAPIIGLALDPTDHRLFLSDTTNNRVLVYNLDSNDLLLDCIPDNVLGQVDFHSNTAASTQIGLETPNGLAYDNTNNRLFVAEGAGSRVKVFEVTAITDGENAVSVLGQVNFTGTTAATTQIGMSQPVAAAYDATGNFLYVSDATLNRVTQYDVAAITDGENATKVLGQANFTSLTAATTQAGMNVPYGLTLSGTDLTTLFVAQGTGNRVTSYDVTAITDGENAVKVLGQTLFIGTTAATTQAGMNAPRGISYDALNQRLYVAQTTAARVTTYNTGDGITDGENAINVLGQLSFTAQTTLVAREGLSGPTGVLADPIHNRVYVSDSVTNRVLSYQTNLGLGVGEPAVSVLGQANFTGTTAATTQAGMNVPYGLALSGSSLTTLFVAQGTGNRVTSYDVTAITDGENAVKVLGQTTFIATTAATTQAGMNAPRGITYDAATKTLYVSQTTGNRVTTYDIAAITDGENAIKVLGQPTFTTTAASTTQPGLNAPNGVIFDSTNMDLYVMQSGASRISIFDVAAITNGENAVDLIGQSENALSPPVPSYIKGTANNAPYSQGMNAPNGVAVDNTNHRLYVADTTNNRVLMYNLTADNVPINRIPDAVLGQANYFLNAVGTTQMLMSAPTGLTVDEANNRLYVADFTNNRILVYDTATVTDGENAAYVLGQPNFILATLGITQVGLSGPRQIAFDSSSGLLYVADASNNRVLSYQVNATVTSVLEETFHFFGF